jgi:hypothetical protein
MANLETSGSLRRTQKGNEIFWYGGGDVAWANIAAAMDGVPVSIRPGKTIGIIEGEKVVEYIWPATGDVTGYPGKKTADVDLSSVALKAGGNDLSGNQNVAGAVNSIVRTSNANMPQNVPGNTLFTSGNFNAHVSYSDYLNYGSRPTFGFAIDGLYGASIYLRSNVEKEPLYFEVQDINGKTDRLALISHINTLSGRIDNLVQHYKGKYATLAALQAVPGVDGDYAILDTGTGSDAIEYIYDSNDSKWVKTTNVAASTFGQLGGVPTDNTALATALGQLQPKEAGKGLYPDSDKVKLGKIYQAFTLSFIAPVREIKDYFETTVYIRSIILDGASSFQYSLNNGMSYTTVSLPLAADIEIPANRWVRWRIGFTSNSTIAAAYIKLA